MKHKIAPSPLESSGKNATIFGRSSKTHCTTRLVRSASGLDWTRPVIKRKFTVRDDKKTVLEREPTVMERQKTVAQHSITVMDRAITVAESKMTDMEAKVTVMKSKVTVTEAKITVVDGFIRGHFHAISVCKTLKYM
jgi:electron transfer flavoprotein alpha subunit